MFSLISGLWTYIFAKPNYNVLVLGLDNAGKTTFLEQVKYLFKDDTNAPAERLHRILPTVGFNLEKVSLFKEWMNLTLWDLGGQTELRKLWKNYYMESHIIVFVIDCTDSERFEEARTELEKALAHPDSEKAPVLILGNKQDQPTAISEESIKKLFALLPVNNKRDVKVQLTCCVDATGIRDAMEWIFRILRSNHDRIDIVDAATN